MFRTWGVLRRELCVPWSVLWGLPWLARNCRWGSFWSRNQPWVDEIEIIVKKLEKLKIPYRFNCSWWQSLTRLKSLGALDRPQTNLVWHSPIFHHVCCDGCRLLQVTAGPRCDFLRTKNQFFSCTTTHHGIHQRQQLSFRHVITFLFWYVSSVSKGGSTRHDSDFVQRMWFLEDKI